MFKVEHYGLYCTPQQVEAAITNSRKPPYRDAFAMLDDLESDDALVHALLDALQYRFRGNIESAIRAGKALFHQGVGFNMPDDLPFMQRCEVLMAMGHVFELIRDCDDVPADGKRGWLRLYSEQVEAVRDADDQLPLLDLIWRTGVKIVGGVVLDRSDIFVIGQRDFKAIVEREIHPEGYMPKLVQDGNGSALVRQVMGAKGLALAAEVAEHVMGDLWGYESRGISVKTTAIYAAAYYEYGSSWQWDEPLTQEETDVLYRENSAFLEMLNGYLRPEILRGTLDKLRPMFDAYGGGLVTLSHGKAAPRRGLFGLRA